MYWLDCHFCESTSVLLGTTLLTVAINIYFLSKYIKLYKFKCSILCIYFQKCLVRISPHSLEYIDVCEVTLMNYSNMIDEEKNNVWFLCGWCEVTSLLWTERGKLHETILQAIQKKMISELLCTKLLIEHSTVFRIPIPENI